MLGPRQYRLPALASENVALDVGPKDL